MIISHIHYTISMSETSSAQERSRSPPRRGSLRMGGRVLPQTGGFTDKAREMRGFFLGGAWPFIWFKRDNIGIIMG